MIAACENAICLPAPVLPLARYRLLFAAPQADPARYTGSAWRGVLGHALKKLVCVTRVPECKDCLLLRSCVYTYVFETPPATEGKMALYPSAPHPYVLLPGPVRNGRAELTLTLFGVANRYLAYIVHSLRSAAEKGLRGQGEMALEQVSQETAPGSDTWTTICNGASISPLSPAPPTLPPPPQSLSLVFQTPLRLRHQETYVTPDRVAFHDVFRNLLRRISLLTYFHTQTPLETDFRRLTEQARSLNWTATDLKWRDWTRYSSRQRTTMRMGGLTGCCSLDLSQSPELWPYLWLGQFTHAGKGTSMGLGSFRIV